MPILPEMARRRRLLIAVLALLGLVARAAGDSADAQVRARAADEVAIVPLRVHVLSGDDALVDCKLTDADVRRIIGKVNRVWRPAGVYFGLESIVREPAANQKAFSDVREQLGAAPLGLYRRLIPDGSRKADCLHVYYVHRLPVNGVFMGGNFAFVQETATLREVEGGIDEPVPRVTAHELGHALGLPHRQDRTNLMASGTTGILLNDAEAETAREVARKRPGAMTVAHCREKAQHASAAGNDAAARRLTEWADDVAESTVVPPK